MLSLSKTATIFVVFAGLCSAKDCTDNGKTYKNGDSWEQGCLSRCTCSEGEFGCLPLCGVTGFPPGCRIVKGVEDCCGHGECKSEMKKKKCDRTAAPGYDSVKSPWTVRVQAGSPAKTCMGTIMNEKSIYVTDSCVGDKDTVSFLHPPPIKDKKSAWSVKQIKKVSNLPNVRELVLADPGIKYHSLLHEVNLPWTHFCKNDSDCQLFLTSFKPKGSENSTTEYVLASAADKSECKLTSKDDASLACLQIPYPSRPKCVNFDGSNVLARIDETYYLIGFLVGLSDKGKDGCDTNKDQYRKYVSSCSKFNLEN